MSDERDPDAAGNATGDDAGDLSDAGQTAAMTGPLRPTGKRSRQRAGGTALAELDTEDEALTEQFDATDADTAGKKVKKAGKDGKPNRNPIAFLIGYVQQVVSELRKVIWPNRKQMVTYTTVVLLFLAFMVALIGLVDLGLAKLVLWVFG